MCVIYGPVWAGDFGNVNPPSKLLTIPEAADYMSVSSRTVERWIRSGEIPRIKIGKVVRIDPRDLEKTIERSKEIAYVETL